MRIYNAKKSQMDLPIGSNTRLTIPSHSVSKDIMPSDDFLTLVASTFDETEIALIVAGAFEINMCAKNPACTPLVCQSLDEAVERFNPAPKEVKKEEIKEEEIKNPVIGEDVMEEEAPVAENEEVKEAAVEEAVVEEEAQFPESENKEEEEITPDSVDTAADEPMTEENSAVVDVKKKPKKKNRR